MVIANRNVVVAFGAREDLEGRLRTFVYDREGNLVLQYQSNRDYIAELGSLRGESLQELVSPDSNGQDIYSLSLGRNPVRNTLLVRIGDYIVERIVNRTKNKDDNRSRPRRKREFYEKDFKNPEFEAEDVLVDGGASYGGSNFDDVTPGNFGRQLTREEERTLFRRFNWVRYRMMDAQDNLRMNQDKLRYLSEIGSLEPKAIAVRDKIARHNMALVTSMARRTKINAHWELLISEGNLALVRAVDRFDYTYGFKFSTYACGAILKAFSRVMVMENRYRNRNTFSFDAELERLDHLETTRDETEGFYLERLREVVKNNEAELTEVESTIVGLRFGFDSEDGEKMTLEEIGKIQGLSKERVRQIEVKALGKLRKAMEKRVN